MLLEYIALETAPKAQRAQTETEHPAFASLTLWLRLRRFDREAQRQNLLGALS
jgi:hypothetical protein